METFKERVIHFQKNILRITQVKFCDMLGADRSYVSTLKGASMDKLETIHKIWPELNIGWLLYGDGDVLLSEDSENLSENKSNLAKQKKGDERLVSNQEIKKILTKQREEMSDLTEIVKDLSRVMALQITSNDSNMDKTIGFMKEQLSTMNEAIKRVDTKTDEIKENVFTINRKVANG